MVNQVQEAQRVPYRINPKRNTPRHILIKQSKIKYKEKILKAAILRHSFQQTRPHPEDKETLVELKSVLQQ